jgi:hypothetical protein
MTTIVKSKSLGDFVALIPALLGFHPTNSLVLIPMANKRTLGGIRIDLPASDTDTRSVAQTCLGYVLKVASVEGIAIFTYGDGEPRRELVDEIVAASRQAGLAIADAAHINADGWTSYFDQDNAVAPVPEASHHAPTGGDQNTGGRLPEADADFRSDVLHALEDASPTLADVPVLAELVASGATLTATHAADLALTLHSPLTRDVLLVQWAAGAELGAEALEAQVGWQAGGFIPEDVQRVMLGTAKRPDPTRLTAALDAVTLLAAHLPEALRPGSLAAAAWLSWALGRSSQAQSFSQMALTIDPDHGLSRIVLSQVGAGMLPEWAFIRP